MAQVTMVKGGSGALKKIAFLRHKSVPKKLYIQIKYYNQIII